MASRDVSEAARSTDALIDLAATEAVFLHRGSNPVAVLISPERYEALLEACEEWEDIEAFDASLAEDGENSTLEEVWPEDLFR